jgi:hypothetical protein
LSLRIAASPCHCGQSEAVIRNLLFFAACRPRYRLEKPDFHNRMQAKRSLRKNGLTYFCLKGRTKGNKVLPFRQRMERWQLPQAALRLPAVMEIPPFGLCGFSYCVSKPYNQ